MSAREAARRKAHLHNDEDVIPQDRNGNAEVTCGNCGRSWCEHCDPGPSALCPFCHGRGYSTAPIKLQRRFTP